MLYITIGYECGDALHCDKRKKCKYRAKWYKLNNISVDIHRFFKFKLHIKLPYLIHIRQKFVRLSGTDKCPHHKSRFYDCYDCKYVSSELLRECSCKERINTPYKERIPDVDVEDWADNYKSQNYLND